MKTREIKQKEKDLIQLIANGWKDDEIAQRMGLSYSTIRLRVNNLLRKSGMINRTQLVYWATKNGVIN